jgi:hypothetical protein
MPDTERPNRSSNMEKAEGDRETSAQNQEQLVERHPHHRDPTRLDEERTSDNSTVENGDLSRGSERNPSLPSDDATLRTEI